LKCVGKKRARETGDSEKNPQSLRGVVVKELSSVFDYQFLGEPPKKGGRINAFAGLQARGPGSPKEGALYYGPTVVAVVI